MKNLSFFNKIIFLINNIFALLFLASFAIPYVTPSSFPLLAVLGLAVPFIILIHVLFVVYWILSGFKRQFFLSTFCIFLAIAFSAFPYKFSGEKVISGDDLKVITYNVHLFNRYNWIDEENIPQKISDFIKEQDPDILNIQEYYKTGNLSIKFPYQYLVLEGEKHNVGMAIFSKYRIINKGSLNFTSTSNNAIFVDILKGNDTIRIYNIHLESTGLKADKDYLGEKNSERMVKRLENSFVKQQEQVERFLEHKSKCHYKVIITGDFNNTAYSWAYKQIKGDMKDSFIEAGEGFGKTFKFKKYPLRIDFILVDKHLNINEHKVFDNVYSDHYPVLAKIRF